MYVIIMDNLKRFNSCDSSSTPGGVFMDQIKQLLFQRLEDAGVGSATVSGLMRDVANCLRIDGNMSLSEVNRRLSYLGWEDGQLDYHTYQLLVAWIEEKAPCRLRDDDDLPAENAQSVSGALA